MENIEKKEDQKVEMPKVEEPKPEDKKPKFNRKEYYKVYSKKYYIENKQKKIEYMKEKKKCEICDKEINRGSLRLHNESMKHRLKELEKTKSK